MRQGLVASVVPKTLRGRLRLSSNLAKSASLHTRPNPAAVLHSPELGLSPKERKVCSFTSFPTMDCEVMKGRLEVRPRVEMRGVPDARPLLWRVCW